MDRASVVTEDVLKTASYRLLQKIAKSMNLPANVQKKYLLELIHAKTFKTQEDLDLLIKNIKEERVLASRYKNMNKLRNRLQASEITSTSSIDSPVLRRTPKRQSQLLLRYSPEVRFVKNRAPQGKQETPKTQTNVTNKTFEPNRSVNIVTSYHLSPTIAKKRCATNSLSHSTLSRNQQNHSMQPKNNKEDSLSSMSSGTKRILRSSERKSGSVASTIDAEENRNFSTINIVSYDGNRKLNLTAFVKKPEPKYPAVPVDTSAMKRQVAQVSRETPQPSRKRTISGISPLPTPEPVPNTKSNVSTAVCSINETVSNLNSIDNITGVYLADVDSITEYIFSDSDLRRSFPNLTFEGSPNGACLSPEPRDLPNDGTSYLFGNQTVSNSFSLPKIVEVFSKFKKSDNGETQEALTVSAPVLEQQASDGTLAATSANLSTSMLEIFYNYKKSFIVPNNSCQIPEFVPPTTKLVYSTKTMLTLMVQQPANMVTTDCIVAPLTQDEILHFNPLATDMPESYGTRENIIIEDFSHVGALTRDEILHFNPLATDMSEGNGARENIVIQDFTHVEDVSSQSSPIVMSSQDLGANVTIPELVEDAMEIISQDGDYLALIQMDQTTRCILCNWIGLQILLEFHVRQEHSSDIIRQESSEWNITFTLASLVRGQWLSKVMEYDKVLYVLSAKYEEPDRLMVSLNVLIIGPEEATYKGKIMIFNKVTGVPVIWQGELVKLPETLSPSNDNFMNIPLSNLDVFPRYTNFNSSKLVAGQPDLNDIQIIVFIELFK